MKKENQSNTTWRTHVYLTLIVMFMLGLSGVGFSRDSGFVRPVPEVKGLFGSIPEKFKDYEVILKPDKDEAEWWAGAPSVVRDQEGIFWLACRMRTADAPRGLRGYEIRILRSEDGIHFRKVHCIKREDVPIPGFERPALLINAIDTCFFDFTRICRGKA